MKSIKNFFILELFVLICLVMATSALYAGEVFHINESTIVKDDLVLIGNSCIIDGTVRGDAVIINGNLELNGTVEGDAVVLGGEVNLYDGGHVNGDMVVISGKMTREDGSIVDGDVVTVGIPLLRYVFKLIPQVAQFSTEGGEVKIEKESMMSMKDMYKGKVGSGLPSSMLLVWGLSLSIVIMLFTVIFSSGSERMVLYLEKKPARSFFTGFLAQILFVPTIIFLALTVLGIPLIPFFILAYPIALLIALVPSSLFTGKRIMKKSEKSYLQSFVGLLILFILLFLGKVLQSGSSVLSIIGWALSVIILFIFYLYFTFGLGSLILSKLGTRNP